MQGRMVAPEEGRFQCFPRASWQDEFERAAQAGLTCLEWIFDGYGMDCNPIETEAGIAEIQALSRSSGVAVLSVCADWFMEMPLVRVEPGLWEERLSRLEWLLERCQLLGANRVVLPFVDASRIETGPELEQAVSAILRVLPAAEAAGVELHLETSLAPQRFADLLNRLLHPLVKVNYDSGNSSSLGFQPREEFAAYGPRIGSIHIKDRILGGSTVPLGTGDADFPALFQAIRQGGYHGDFILQAARGTSGDEVAWARRNRAFVVQGLESVQAQP